MANQAYLIKTSEGKSEELFEANNTIPLFWFTLLDSDTIERSEKILMDCYDSYIESDDDDEDKEIVNIIVSKTTFIKNSTAGKRFIEKKYPDKVNLYNDFIKYLDNKLSETDQLELNIFEIAQFFTMDHLVALISNTVDCIESLNLNELQTFEPSRSSIYDFVGYDVFFGNQFKNYSVDYLESLLKDKKEKELRDKKSVRQRAKEKRKEKFKNIFMCVGGIAFIGASILMIIKNGSYFMGIVGIIFGGIALLFGILNLKG